MTGGFARFRRVAAATADQGLSADADWMWDVQNAYASYSVAAVLLVVLGSVLYLSLTLGLLAGMTGIAICVGMAAVSFSLTSRA